jgi:peptide/nickel transport system permease protein
MSSVVDTARVRPDAAPPQMGGLRRVWHRFRRRRRARVGLAALVLILLVALLRPVLASELPIVCKYEGQWHAPGLMELVRKIPFVASVVGPSRPFALPSFDARQGVADSEFVIDPPIACDPLSYSADLLAPPSSGHWLGTDELGRDVAARLVHGTAVSLAVGLGAMGIAAVIGVIIGAAAGYAGGWFDAACSRLIEVVMCFPAFFLILAIMVWLEEPGAMHVILVLGLTGWTTIARLTRGEMIRMRDSDFVVASRALGAGPGRVILRHLLPNAMAPIIVTVTFGVARAVLLEAGLSWLGFGVPAPAPSWGNMLRSAYEHLVDAPHLVYPPCIAIFVTVLVYNWVGDALQNALDPRTGASHLPVR